MLRKKDSIELGNVINLDPSDAGVSEENQNQVEGPPPKKSNEELQLADVIIPTSYTQTDSNVKLKAIVAEFNKGKRNILVEDQVFGVRTPPGKLRLIHRNKITQIIPNTRYPLRFEINATGEQGELGMFNQTDIFIGKHDTFLVNVPQKKIAKAWINNEAVLLGEGSHVIRDATFRLEKKDREYVLVDQTSPIIQHGTITILQIPKGKIAKIWNGTQPILLESREEPYVFNSPKIRIEPFKVEYAGPVYFADASARFIDHGSIKRLMPRTGEVIYGSKNGCLEIFHPQSTPYLVDDTTIEIESKPFSTQIQTIQLPTQRLKEKRKKDGMTDPRLLNCLVFRTRDQVEIGVNLEVVYWINDAKKVLSRFNADGIEPHIESIVISDMNSLISQSTAASFQNSDQTQIREKIKKSNFPEPSAPPPDHFYMVMQEDIKKKLIEQLEELGVTLSRVSLDPPQILDKEVAVAMTHNSMSNVETQAQIANLENKYAIATQDSMRKAEQDHIAAQNKAKLEIIQAETAATTKIKQAEALLLAARKEAEAITIKAEAEVAVKRMIADMDIQIAKQKTEVELENQRRRNDIDLEFLRQRSQILKDNPAVLQLELAKINGQAMQGVQQVLSPDTFANWYGSPGNAVSPLFQRPILNPTSKSRDLAREISREREKTPELTRSSTGLRRT
jgi:hypothetical protein